MPQDTIYGWLYRGELRAISKLPKAERDAAISKCLQAIPAPYVVVRLWEDGAAADAPVRADMERLRVQLRRAGIVAATADQEFREVEAYARQVLGFSAAEFAAATIEELETAIRHRNPPKRSRGTRSQSPELADLRHVVRELKECGSSQVEICKNLDARGTPRPPNTAWSHLAWSKALRDERFRGAVKRWISGC